MTVYCIICGQRIHQIAFLNWLYQYLSFLNIFFNRFSPVEKCGVTPHGLYRDSLTLIYYISSNRRRTLAAPLITRIKVSVTMQHLPYCIIVLKLKFIWKGQKQSFEIWYDVFLLLFPSFKRCNLIITKKIRKEIKAKGAY